jgi:hypothetical protein
MYQKTWKSGGGAEPLRRDEHEEQASKQASNQAISSRGSLISREGECRVVTALEFALAFVVQCLL